jgi:arylsulfatase
VYNFLGEREQWLSAPDPIPLGQHVFGVQFKRRGTVEGSHTPVGEASLHIDDAVVATLSDMITQPGAFALAGGGVSVGRNTGQAVSSAYRSPFGFTGGTIADVTVDVSGEPYLDVKKSLAAAFSRD